MKIPTTIFTGFLGSGKTTIIGNLIDYLQNNGHQVIYIKNEIGDTDIDTKIMQQKGIETEELLNGCICCTLVGPFLNSIDELIHKFKPTRIIIEASGAADPAALALMVSAHPQLTRDGVISIIDVLNFEGYEELTITAKEQTKFTDVLIFNKVELVDLEQKRRVVAYVRELNTHSPIVEAPYGKVNPDVIFGTTTQELDSLLSQHKDNETHVHIHTDSFEALTLYSKKTFEQDNLEQSLSQLPKNIFRSKGIVQTTDGWQVFNTVANRVTFETLQKNYIHPPAGEPTSSIFVFIGVGVNDQKDILEQIIEKA